MHQIFSMAPGKQQIYNNYKIVLLFTLTVLSSNITIMVSVSHSIFRH